MALQTQKIIDLSSMPEEPSVDDTGKGISILATVDANATGIGAAMHCAADGHWEEADASADTTAPCTGLALSSGTGASKEILQQGQVRNDGWTWVTGPGEKGLIYLSITTGALTQTAPTGDGEIVQIVGHAITDDVMMFNPQLQWIELGSGLSILLADGSVPLTEDWDVLDNKITAQNLAADALTAGRLVYTGASGLLSAAAAGTWDGSTLGIDGAAVFNDSGADNDFRVEGSGNANALFVHGSNGYVGVGTDAPVLPLDVIGGIIITQNSLFSSNLYYDGGWKYKDDGYGGLFKPAGNGGTFAIETAPLNSSGAEAAATTAVRFIIDCTSGNVGIGPSAPAASAILDVTSTTKAFLPPRMTTAQRDAIVTEVTGMVLYNTTTSKLQVCTDGSTPTWADCN